jgi:K+-transporting ATPase KdpF subunit
VGETEVNAAYVIAGLAVLVLFFYLCAALLKPEWFE